MYYFLLAQITTVSVFIQFLQYVTKDTPLEIHNAISWLLQFRELCRVL